MALSQSGPIAREGRTRPTRGDGVGQLRSGTRPSKHALLVSYCATMKATKSSSDLTKIECLDAANRKMKQARIMPVTHMPIDVIGAPCLRASPKRFPEQGIYVMTTFGQKSPSLKILRMSRHCVLSITRTQSQTSCCEKAL